MEQYADAASSLVQNIDPPPPPILSTTSLINGRGYVSFFVTSKCSKITDKPHSLVVFLNAFHGEVDGRIISFSNISFNCLFTSSSNAWGILKGFLNWGSASLVTLHYIHFGFMLSWKYQEINLEIHLSTQKLLILV